MPTFSNDELNQKLLEKDNIIKQLKEESSILQNILSLLPANIYWKSKDGVFQGCNESMVKAMGFESSDQIIGKQIHDFTSPHIANAVLENDQFVYQTGRETDTEEVGFDLIKNEPAIFFSKRKPLIDSNGNITGLLSVSFNITDRKNMEENLKLTKNKAEEANRAKSKFLGMVTHELRTPLSSIIGLSHFLHAENLPTDERKKIVDAIENCASHLLNLVNDMLDFSQLDANKYKPRQERVDLRQIANNVINMTQPLALNKGLHLNVNISPNTPDHVYSDERIIRQILINLTSNAIKFSEQGAVTIGIEAISQKNHRHKLKISVKDNGRGIPKEKFDLIFKPFQQLDDAITRQSSRNGTGLGLTIVNILATLINAEINIESEVGKGSTFSVVCEFATERNYLPLIETSKPNPLTDPTSLYHQSSERSPKVLLIEDDNIVQYIHKKMLVDLNCRVDLAASGQQAISQFNHHNFVFVDISLPDINGFDLIKAIRHLDKHNKTVIIALTAYTGEEEMNACLEAGANEFVSKPVSQAALLTLLARYTPNTTQPTSETASL